MKWLSPKSVAERLDVHRTTAMRMMKDGTLPGFELRPGMWRVSEENLLRSVRMKEKKVRPTKPDGYALDGKFERRTPAVQAGGNPR